MRSLSTAALLVLAAAPSALAQPDVKVLIRQSLENYDRAWRAGMQWGYTEEDVTCSDGKKDIAISEIAPLDGTPYDRLVSKNGKPLSPEEQRKEDQKFEKALKQRQSESPEDRAARIQKYAKERAFVKEIPEAYDFKLLGEEVVNNRPAWVVTLTPRAEFVPTTPHADLLKHIQGKLWIDKQDLQWARAEANVIDTISIGLILARIGSGAHITLDMRRVAQGLWMPSDITINGAAKVLLVHTKNLDEHLTFSAYHPATGNSGPGTQVAAELPAGARSYR